MHLLQLHLRRIMNKKITINNQTFELIENYKDGYTKEDVEKKIYRIF